MASAVFEQISHDHYVLKKFVVPSISALQVVEHNTANNYNYNTKDTSSHLLRFEERTDSPTQSVSTASLDLSEMFAVTHGDSRDSLLLFASLRVSNVRRFFSNCSPVKNNDGDTNNNNNEFLRLGIYEFQVKNLLENESGAFLALYEQLVRIIEAKNVERAMPKRLVIFLNPHSGENMRACRIFSHYVSPLFKLVSINFKVIVLTLPSNPLRLNAEDLGKKWSLPPGAVEMAFENPSNYCLHADYLDDYDGVLCIGGDGTLSDVMVGILKRKHGVDRKILPSTEFQRVEKPAFGVIPAGSTDSMALTAYGNNDPLTAVLSVISGRTVGIDVQAIFDAPTGFHPNNNEYAEEKAEFCRFCFTGVGGGGFVPRIVEMGRSIRPLFGAQRFTVAGVPIFVANKLNSLAVYYKSAPVQPKENRIFCGIDCKHCGRYVNQTPYNMSLVAASDPWIRMPHTQYFGVNIMSNAVLSKYQPAGVSPHGHLGDGACDMILHTHQPTAFHYLYFSHKMGSVARDMYDKNGIQLFRVLEYSVEPTETADNIKSAAVRTKSNTDESRLLCTADGELFRCRRLLGIVHCQLFQMYGCGRPIVTPSK